MDQKGKGVPQKSIQGYIIFVTGVHPEAQEDHVLDKFREFGEVRNLHLNIDRRTGYCKGYALLEYELLKEAEKAIGQMDAQDFLGEQIRVTWAFKPTPPRKG